VCVASESVVTEIPGLDEILAGSEAGWDEFYEHYLPIVTNQVGQAGIVSTLNGNATTKDVAHEVIAKLARNNGQSLKGLEDRTDEGMTRYLRKSVKNHHRDLIREKIRHREHWGEEEQTITDDEGRETFSEEDLAEGYLLSRMIRPDEAFELKETAEIISKSLDDLNPTYATIIRMLAVGSPHKEIAQELGVNVKSVGSLVKRARKQLKSLLIDRYPDHFEDSF
jgi:RNA polymerase sigma factor (sigma-70 family)